MCGTHGSKAAVLFQLSPFGGAVVDWTLVGDFRLHFEHRGPVGIRALSEPKTKICAFDNFGLL